MLGQVYSLVEASSSGRDFGRTLKLPAKRKHIQFTFSELSFARLCSLRKFSRTGTLFLFLGRENKIIICLHADLQEATLKSRFGVRRLGLFIMVQ